MFNILAQYAIIGMLDAEDKAYRSELRDISDKKTNVHEKRGSTGVESNALKQLGTYIKEMDKLQGKLDELEHDIKERCPA